MKAKKFLSVFLALTLAVGLIPATALTASASDWDCDDWGHDWYYHYDDGVYIIICYFCGVKQDCEIHSHWWGWWDLGDGVFDRICEACGLKWDCESRWHLWRWDDGDINRVCNLCGVESRICNSWGGSICSENSYFPYDCGGFLSFDCDCNQCEPSDKNSKWCECEYEICNNCDKKAPFCDCHTCGGSRGTICWICRDYLNWVCKCGECTFPALKYGLKWCGCVHDYYYCEFGHMWERWFDNGVLISVYCSYCRGVVHTSCEAYGHVWNWSNMECFACNHKHDCITDNKWVYDVRDGVLPR